MAAGLLVGPGAVVGSPRSEAAASPVPVPSLLCGPAWGSAPTDPPDYYAIDLIPTGRVPGTRLSKGVAQSRFASSPFGVSLSPNGEYVHELIISVEGLRQREGREYVVWVSTSELDQIVRIGALDENFQAHGTVGWNKFLVIVTLEEVGSTAPLWEGPLIMRGMSRSGRMHTMAGHGAFEVEPCAKYGYQ